MEYSLRDLLHTAKAYEMNEKFRSTITNKIMNDTDLEFRWVITSVAIEEDIIII